MAIPSPPAAELLGAAKIISDASGGLLRGLGDVPRPAWLFMELSMLQVMCLGERIALDRGCLRFGQLLSRGRDKAGRLGMLPWLGSLQWGCSVQDAWPSTLRGLEYDAWKCMLGTLWRSWKS